GSPSGAAAGHGPGRRSRGDPLVLRDGEGGPRVPGRACDRHRGAARAGAALDVRAGRGGLRRAGGGPGALRPSLCRGFAGRPAHRLGVRAQPERRLGGYTMSNSAAWNLDRMAASREPEPATRILNMNRLGEDLLERHDPPVTVLFVYNCNPVATMPNQEKVLRGLAREDLFTIVFEQVWTDTARLADLVLPATTFLEHDEMSRGYGAMLLHRISAVAEPVGEARPNYEVF